MNIQRLWLGALKLTGLSIAVGFVAILIFRVAQLWNPFG
jgi:hypothetical protein